MSDCLDLDRVSPTRRPDAPSAGTQRWSELLFVHWSFPPDVVRKLVPSSFELDLWQGRAWVGVVPFRMEATRPSWLPKRTGLDFLETNLRTYVHRNGEPGVFFFSLEASSWLAVRAARLAWSLPYFHAKMTAERAGDRVGYHSERRGAEARIDVEYEIGPALGPSAVGSLQHFLLERYYLFVERRGVPVKGQVHHVPYPAREAKLVSIEQSLLTAAGLHEGGRLETVHYSDGVEVEVFGPFDT